MAKQLPIQSLRPNNAARPKQRNPHFCETRAVQCKSVDEGFDPDVCEGGRNRIVKVVELKTQPMNEKYASQSQIGSFGVNIKKHI